MQGMIRKHSTAVSRNWSNLPSGASLYALESRIGLLGDDEVGGQMSGWLAVFLLDWCSGEAEVGHLLLNKRGGISSIFFNVIPKNCISAFSIETNTTLFTFLKC